MQIELIPEKSFTVRAGTKAIHGLFHVSEWEGLNKYQDNSGHSIILDDGKIGEGELFQGVRNGGGARAADYAPTDSSIRRWMTLSNGNKICDFNGNVFQRVFDNVQGNDKGVIAKEFAKDSPSLTIAPYLSEKKGMGCQPVAGADWSGYALIRGGCWLSDVYAGVFCLYYDHPGVGCIVGFRCALP